MVALSCSRSVLFFKGSAKNGVRIDIIQDHDVLVALTGNDGETTRLVGVDLAADGKGLDKTFLFVGPLWWRNWRSSFEGALVWAWWIVGLHRRCEGGL